MFPFKDDNPISIFPFVTIGLIVINTIVFLLQMFHPAGFRYIVFAYGAVPNFILTFKDVQPVHPLLTVFTSMFMHGSLFHLGGNMLYLWIFGNNIEDTLGHVKFILFYLFCGFVATYSHALTEHSAMTPMVGASGAVSGILGAYLLLFPRARVHTLIFFFFFVQVIRLPALIVIGFWIIVQFVNGIVSKGAATHGGVAWFAHIGGFAFGILTIKLFIKSKRRRFSS